MTRRSFFRRAAAGALAAVAAAYVPNLVSATPLSAEQYAATGILELIQTRRAAAMQDMIRQFEEQCWGEAGNKRFGEALAEYKVVPQPHGTAYWVSDRVTLGSFAHEPP